MQDRSGDFGGLVEGWRKEIDPHCEVWLLGLGVLEDFKKKKKEEKK